MISETYHLAEIGRAYDRVAEGRFGIAPAWSPDEALSADKKRRPEVIGAPFEDGL